MSEKPVIEAHSLVKQYPSVRAVDDISFSVSAGSCFGLLGSNGAGKTTTVEMLEGLVIPTSGKVRYKGAPLDAGFTQEIGIMFQATALQDYINVDETLNLFASLYQNIVHRDWLIESCQLQPILHQRVSSLSGGQKQRLLLAIALVNDPEVIFLDEPTTGMDPYIRTQFWQLITDLKAKGKTIILTTHYMDEAYQLCDQVLFMELGSKVVQGKPADLLAQHFDEVVLSLPQSDAATQAMEETWQTFVREGRLHIKSRDVDNLLRQLQKKNISLAGIEVRSPTLEELFITLVGKSTKVGASK